jgi:hypothetical protein
MFEFLQNAVIRQFCENEVFPLLQSLMSGTYRLPEVQTRYISNCTEIAQRYKCSALNHGISDMKPLVGTATTVAMFGYGFTESSLPQVTIFLHSLYGTFEEERALDPVGFRQPFGTRVVIGYMHELDHLAKGFAGKRHDPIETHLRNETFAQAETCEYTIRPIFEIHKLRVTQDILTRYSHWLRAERNVHSPYWTSYIHLYIETYSKLGKINHPHSKPLEGVYYLYK